MSPKLQPYFSFVIPATRCAGAQARREAGIHLNYKIDPRVMPEDDSVGM